MNLYLMRHGEARSKAQDPERSLTRNGRERAREVAEFCAKRGRVKPRRIFHSGKKRAAETAEILCKALESGEIVERADNLAPMDSPVAWAERLELEAEDVALVGHLPHLGRLAGLLVTGSAERSVVSFQAAAIVCLSRDEFGDWSVSWAVAPELL